MSDSLLVLVPELRAAAVTLGDPRVKGLVEAVEEHGREARLRVLVIGLTGSGRAAVISALLGCPGLVPSTVAPKAPLSVLLRYGAAPAVEAVAVDGGRTALPPSGLRSFLCDPASTARYGAVEVRAPCEQLQLCEVRIEALEAARPPEDWRALLAASDFVVVVLNATAALSQLERDFLRQHLAEGYGFHRVALVVNRMDLVPEEDQPSILSLVGAFLGPFASQPALIDVSATGLQSREDVDHPLRTLFQDLVGRRAEMRDAALQQACEIALTELADVVAREQARAAMDEADVERLRETMARRKEWLQGRIDRTQRRVDAFAGTLLREQLQQQVQAFGEVFRRRLPEEIRDVQDLSTIRRYLPGYIETVWQDALQERMIGIRDKLLDEADQIERLVDGDLQELVDEADLRDVLGDFDPARGRMRTFVMPKRGKHSASSVARGLSLHGFVMLIVASFFGLTLVPALMSLGASHAVRRIFRRDIEAADREAIITSALAASRDLERELQSRIDQQFSRLVVDLREEVAAQYAEGIERVETLLEQGVAQRGDRTAWREQLSILDETTIPELRRALQRLGQRSVA